MQIIYNKIYKVKHIRSEIKMQNIIGKRIKEIREENNLTMKEFGKKMGFSESIISRYENGKVEPRKSTLDSIAGIFKVNEEWLKGYEDAPKYIEESSLSPYDSYIPFPDRLKLMIQETNVTLTDLSNATSIPLPRLEKLVDGIRDPWLREMQNTADYFNVSKSWMFGVRGAPRNIEVNETKFKKVPVLGTITAYSAISEQDDIVALENVPEHDGIDFCLRVKGDSMINARVYDGDIVFVKQQNTVENGDIAVVLMDDETTLKRFYRLNGSIILRAENPMYKDIIIKTSDNKNVKILGKAIAFKSRLL